MIYQLLLVDRTTLRPITFDNAATTTIPRMDGTFKICLYNDFDRFNAKYVAFDLIQPLIEQNYTTYEDDKDDDSRQNYMIETIIGEFPNIATTTTATTATAATAAATTATTTATTATTTTTTATKTADINAAISTTTTATTTATVTTAATTTATAATSFAADAKFVAAVCKLFLI